MSHADNTQDNVEASKRLTESFPILLQVVENCSSLADNLDAFIENYLKKKKGPKLLFGTSSVYDAEFNTIYIQQGEQLYSLIETETIASLAHEVAHAVSIIGADVTDKNGDIEYSKLTLNEYINLIHKKEGEAIYYEFLALGNSRDSIVIERM